MIGASKMININHGWKSKEVEVQQSEVGKVSCKSVTVDGGVQVQHFMVQ